MKSLSIALFASVAAAPLLAQEHRDMDAHVHGVSTLELAIEHGEVVMNLTSPGADIVGFEYEASSDEDKDAVEAAIRLMLTPENLVTLPEAAECRLAEVLAHLHGEDHAHDDEEEHGHDDHADEEAHGEGEDHDDHAESDDHAYGDGEAHSEFHARYIFDCEHPDALTTIGFPFFEKFGNAQEIEATYVTEAGAGTAEIERDAPELTLN